MYRNNDLGDKIIAVAYRLREREDFQDLGDQLIDIARDLRRSTIVGSLPPDSVMGSALRLFRDTGVSAAVIGGVAAAAMGHTRNTQDIDFLVNRLPDVSDRQYMRSLGFYPARSRTGTVLTIDHDKAQIELLLANDPIRRHALKTARSRRVLGHAVSVVTPESFVALKLASLHDNPKRGPLDRSDISFVFDKVNVGALLKLLPPQLETLLWTVVPKP